MDPPDNIALPKDPDPEPVPVSEPMPAPMPAPMVEPMPEPMPEPKPERLAGPPPRRDSTGSTTPLTMNSTGSTPAASPIPSSRIAAPPTTRYLAGTFSSGRRTTASHRQHVRSPTPLRAGSITRLPSADTRIPVSSVPSMSWTSRVNQRMIDADNSNQLARAASSSRPINLVPLSAEKPLPPRPIAVLDATRGRLNDGGSLIAADEHLPQLSTGNKQLQALIPRSHNVPASDSQMAAHASASPSLIPRLTSTSTSSLARLAKAANLRDTGTSRASAVTHQSSQLSFISARESTSNETHNFRTSPLHVDSRTEINTASSPAVLHHYHSVRSAGDLETLGGKSLPQLPTQIITSHAVAQDDDERKSNIPPVNFSRLQEKPTIMAVDTDEIEPTTQQYETALAIPMRPKKRGTPIRVDTRGLHVESEYPAENSPPLGSRHLGSPAALAILDQGVKRRLQRAASAKNDSPFIPRPIRKFRIGDRSSRSSSLADTTGVSSDEWDELDTPITPSSLPRSSSMAQLTPSDPDQDQYDPDDFNPLDEDLRRLPPSKSRHTKPLQTIPSQSVLASTGLFQAQSEDDEPFESVPSYLSNTTNEKSRHCPKGTGASELNEVLSNVNDDENAQDENFVPADRTEIKNQLTRTLSQLEGHGTPPVNSVNSDQLFHMFGHLGPRVSSMAPSETLIDNAATAQRFVEGGSVSSEQIAAHKQRVLRRIGDHYKTGGHGLAATEPIDGPAAPNLTSKWSDSTPSAMASSSEESRKLPRTSTAFPPASRLPSATAAAPARDLDAADSILTSSVYSSILDSTNHNSLKATDNTTHIRDSTTEPGRYAHMASGLNSKKTARTPPSVGKTTRPAPINTRGRHSSAIPTRIRSQRSTQRPETAHGRAFRHPANASNMAESRGRTKSRAVLAKINTFFSQKREKKSRHMPDPPPTTPEPEQGESTTVLAAEEGASPALLDDASDVVALTQRLATKAKAEISLQRKLRLLNLARILSDATVGAREAQIAAEMAKKMAREAELAHRKVRRGLAAMERLASSLL